MDIVTQIYSILYSFFFGIIFGFLYHICFPIAKLLSSVILQIIFTIISAFIYIAILFIINNNQFHLYLLLLNLGGFILSDYLTRKVLYFVKKMFINCFKK